jgi:hypothetical protein
MDDIVYLKKDIKGDKFWENNPHLVFGIYLGITMILFFGGMFALIFIGCPNFLLTIYLIGICILCVVLAMYRNEMCNISKSIAFIKRDGILYEIKLGYLEDINYQTLGSTKNIVLGGVKFAHDVDVAGQVQLAEKEVRERRKKAEVYSAVLDKILESGVIPRGVTEFIKLDNPHIEKTTKNFIWITYNAGAERKSKKFRNAYDLDLK